MRLKTMWTMLGATLLAVSVQAQEKQEREIGEAAGKKLTYLNDVARFDKGQILLGHLAQNKSDNMRIQQFGQTLVTNHQQHLDDLKAWADSRAMQLSSLMERAEEQGVGGAGGVGVEAMNRQIDQYVAELEMRDKKAAEKFVKLRDLQGEEFDKEFLSVVIDEQKRGQKLIKEGVKNYKSDASLASFLARTEPVLQRHIQTAEQLKKAMKG